MKYSKTSGILLASMGLCGCANFGMGENLMSSKLQLHPVPDGFVATQRAGVDRLANDPTWETIRLQNLLTAVRSAGYCPNGIESVQRKLTPVRSIDIGTSRDLVYNGRCKQADATAGPSAVPARAL